MKLTNSQQDYLRAIYILSNSEKEVRVTDIAEYLKITKASVNNGIKTLKNNELVNYEPYGHIELTEAGKTEATKILEATDIVKMFLTDLLGIDNDKAEDEANKIKTILSDDSLNKLAKFTYNELGLNLNCEYDINNSRCIVCPRKTTKQN